MKVRVKVYDKGGLVANRLDLNIVDDTYIDQATSDIHDFLTEQYFEISDYEEGEE